MSITVHALLTVAICAGVTMLLRAAPFAFFGLILFRSFISNFLL